MGDLQDEPRHPHVIIYLFVIVLIAAVALAVLMPAVLGVQL